MPFTIVRNDITKMKVDAIVCNGNRDMEKRDGVCGAVFAAAGPQLAKYCAPLFCDTGAAVVTPGFSLPAKCIVHTVGPHWTGGQRGEEEILRCCYRNSLNAAAKYQARTIAIPLIASGRYRYPKEAALLVAGEEIQRFLEKYPSRTVYLVVYGPEATLLSKSLQAEIQEFITKEEYEAYRKEREKARFLRGDANLPENLADALAKTEPSFSELLMAYVERDGRKWPEIYKKAQVTKGVASKLKNGTCLPSKGTALAFAFALKLNLGDTERLLRSFGAALSPAYKADLIVKYFIQTGNYSRTKLDYALYDNGLPCLTNNL